MCDNCKDSNKQDQIEELKEIETDEKEPLYFLPPLEITTDNLAEDVNIQLDKDEFIRGLKDASYVCGMYTALVNCGISLDDAVVYIFNRMNIDNNIKISEISANSSIEVSKNASSLKDKDML